MMSTEAELQFKLWCAAAATRRQSQRLFSMSCGRTLLARALAPDQEVWTKILQSQGPSVVLDM